MAADWMPHPLNTRDQQNIAKMMMEQGIAGYGAYWALIETLAKEPTHQLPLEFNVLGYRLHIDAGLIKSVVSDYGLFAFTENGECMYSEDVNNWASDVSKMASKKAEAGKRGAKKRWQNHSTAIADLKQSHGKPIAEDSTLHDTTLQNNTKETPPKSPKGDGSVLSLPEEFATEVWPAYPKKQGNYAKSQEAYVQAVESGETNKGQVLAKIAEYKAYIKLNNKQEGFVTTAGNWFTGHGWRNEYDTKTPEKKELPEREGRQESYGGIEF
ncbi:DUF4373 domain-containing protein [Lacticaseibacillus paracasei]|uniref:DUF4373 domain-containing protein n=1 Tax=Lacticaseibacillus paracasei TaxID=1597 RepID=UPI0021A325E0|nr:DUF4373 domain-containing protein [Lacticaseibacillus paracasei]MCT4383948.1 DUF4373 domain-containing protein [Lacticaseibacillus paracasei]